MPKICVQSPEVRMEGDIRIHAKIAVQTTAKLDEIKVQGACGCDGPPPPPPDIIVDTDLVFLVDGSDSFETTKISNIRSSVITQSGGKEQRSQFAEAMQWCGDFTKKFKADSLGNVTSTIVQFSGVKGKESDYEPDSNGCVFAGDESLKHYNIEFGPHVVADDDTRLNALFETDALDGNSQLQLALQDMSSETFTSKLDELIAAEEDHIKNRILIVITDEEWDVRSLKTSRSLNKSISSVDDLDDEDTSAPSRRISRYGAKKNDTLVPEFAASVYNQMFAVIVRTNHAKDLNEEFIKESLCKGVDNNYHKIYADNFYKNMEDAQKKILKDSRRVVKL